MRIITILVLIFLGIWLPIAFMDAMELQASIDAVRDTPARLARLGR